MTEDFTNEMAEILNIIIQLRKPLEYIEEQMFMEIPFSKMNFPSDSKYNYFTYFRFWNSLVLNLQNAGITNINTLLKYSKIRLLKVPKIGKKAVEEIESQLIHVGLKLPEEPTQYNVKGMMKND